MEAFFHEQLELVAAEALAHANIPEAGSLTAALNPTDLKVILRRWAKLLRTKITPRMKQWYSDQMEIAAQQLPEAAQVFIGPNVRDTRAVAAMGSIENRLTGVGETLYHDVTEAMRVSLETGQGPVKAAERVQEILGSTKNRATVIARTEAAATVNGADFSVASELHQAGIVTTKEWLSTHDTRTRPTHSAADGQKVPQDQPFMVGGAMLQFPADPNGPAAEVIQCRCTTLLGVDEPSLKAAAANRPIGPTDNEKIKNAEIMFGTDSPQHREAIRRFGSA